MKAVIIAALLFTACNSKESQLQSLKKEKAILEDSLKYYSGSELIYQQKAKEAARATHDSLIYLPILDTSFLYSNLAFACKSKIDSIAKQIDILQ